MTKRKTDFEDDQYDSPWKEIIEEYFQDFMTFFFPKAAQEIDWTKGYEFLDKEFQKVVREASSKQGRVDKLVKVWRKTGEQAWVYIHIDVQSQYEMDFAKRMFIYNYRIFDRYQQPVATFVIYGDKGSDWEPNHYGYKLWGCEMGLKFATVKLLGYVHKWAELDKNPNPFAFVVKAHLYAKHTKDEPEERYKQKWRLTRSLYERGYSKQDVLNLFRFIDWVMTLPEEFSRQFNVQIEEYEEKQKMRYITSVERIGIQKGIRQGALQAVRENILDILQARFQNVPLPQVIVEMVNSIHDSTLLKRLHQQSIFVESVQTFQQQLAEATAAQ